MLETLISTISDFAKDELKRNERVIKLLKHFNLDPDHPPGEFSGIYNYALVEYGVGKSLAILQLFREEDIQKAFRKAYDADNPNLVIEEVEKILQPDEWNILEEGIREDNIDVLHELAEFSAVFLKVVELSRSPAEVKRDRNIASLQQELEVIKEQLHQLGSLGEIRTELAKLTQLHLQKPHPASGTPLLNKERGRGEVKSCKAENLALQLQGWFETLGYQFEKYKVWEADFFELIIKIQGRRRFDRILVRGIDGEAEISDLVALDESVKAQKTDEGWLVAARRVSRAARNEVNKDGKENLFCYTLDELIDETADFTNYINWLEDEVKKRKVYELYVPLACRKEEFDPLTKQKMGVSRYEEEDGWIDGYVDLWIDDPAKEHLSILGEFGTGKTWFTFHYAYQALLKYQEAKQRGLTRPRLPLVILLRDYAKALDVENVMAGFFFSQHQISLNISVFEQLNRMGKLLLIFDGFDEMAARVDKQQMVNNFWELAKVVVSGAKVILTCRTEHFPEAKQGRSLLNAELRASVANLTAESPQFEVLELEKFNDEQIRQVLANAANSESVDKVMNNPQLLDLARRPVMSDLILEALPDIEAGKPVDMSRVYLYAVRRKMERDIKSERTFTSLVDKMYFLCELAWEMLSTDQMSLNYRLFPVRIRRLFGSAVEEQKDLDHWHYDMMGQTMLVRNADGDYTPAHRSLLEFFVAFKFAGELGVLADDFVEVVRNQFGEKEKTIALEFSETKSLSQQFLETQSSSQQFLETESSSQQFLETESPSQQFLETQSSSQQFSETQSSSQQFSETESLSQQFSETQSSSQQFLETQSSSQQFSETQSSSQQFSETESPSQQFLEIEKTIALQFSWGEYFQNHVDGKIETLALEKFKSFKSEALEKLRETVGRSPLTKAVLDLLVGMVDRGSCIEKLLAVIEETKGKSEAEVGYVGGNAATVLVRVDCAALQDKDLSGAVVKGGNFNHAILCNAYFKRSNLSEATFPKALDSIISMAFNPSGKLLAVGDFQGLILLIDTKTGKDLVTLKGHSNVVSSVTFNSSGQMLATTSYDRTIKLWNLHNYKCIKILQSNFVGVASIAFSPDNRIIAGSGYKIIQFWDVATGECLLTLQGHTDSVKSITFSPNGQILASASYDATIRLWNVHTGKCVSILKGHLNRVRSVAFSSDGEILASSGNDRTVRLWNIHTGQCISVLKGHIYTVRSVAFSPDGKILASSSFDTTIRLWDISTQKCLFILKEHKNEVRGLAFHPETKILASGGGDAKVNLWDIQNGKLLKSLYGISIIVRSVDFSTDNKILASSGEDNIIKLWSIDNGKCFQILEGHSSWVVSVKFSPNGKLLASCSFDSTVKLWNIKNSNCISTYKGHSNEVSSICFSPDSKLLASCDLDKVIKLWDINTGECLLTIEGHTDCVHSVIFNPDGKTLASGSFDTTIKLWDIHTGKCISSFGEHRDKVHSLSFSSDGQILASGSTDKTVKLWNINTGECIRTLQEPDTSWIQSITFSPDGKIVVSGGRDKVIRLWDVNTGKCVKSLCEHTGSIRSVAFTPDGNFLASGSDDGTIKIWNIETGECIKTLSNKPYAQMNITNATGLTPEQKSSLKALGAVENS